MSTTDDNGPLSPEEERELQAISWAFLGPLSFRFAAPGEPATVRVGCGTEGGKPVIVLGPLAEGHSVGEELENESPRSLRPQEVLLEFASVEHAQSVAEALARRPLPPDTFLPPSDRARLPEGYAPLTGDWPTDARAGRRQEAEAVKGAHDALNGEAGQ